jgi:hypothetical protein
MSETAQGMALGAAQIDVVSVGLESAGEPNWQ